MGKIKVRTLGTETEEQEKKEQKKKREEKKVVHLPGMKGGQRVVAVGPSEEELARLDEKSAEPGAKVEGKKEKKAKFKKAKRARSKKYLSRATLVDKSKKYDLGEALKILEQMQSPAKQDSALQKKTFDETVELHLNTSGPKIQTSTTLPHGVGKSLKVAIASDALIAQVEKGNVDFDILLAHPSMMPKLAKVAKVLGPKGLMPNPKAGTITNDPEKEAKKYEGGLTFIKTESKAPIVHVAVGKVSFGTKKLSENIDAVFSAVKKENIEKAVLKSTMSPGIKISV